MLTNRLKETILARLRKIPDPETVKVVTMDMTPAYRDLAKLVFPNATVVIDKFHVLQLLNRALNAVRIAVVKRQAAEPTPDPARRFRRDRAILLKRHHDLKDSEKRLLAVWLADHKDLAMAYDLKEEFYKVYDASNMEEAWTALHAWSAIDENAQLEAFDGFNKTIDNWHPEILNFINFPETNAYTEAHNGLISLANHNGRGYEFDVLRGKMLYASKAHKKPRKAKNAADRRPISTKPEVTGAVADAIHLFMASDGDWSRYALSHSEIEEAVRSLDTKRDEWKSFISNHSYAGRAIIIFKEELRYHEVEILHYTQVNEEEAIGLSGSYGASISALLEIFGLDPDLTKSTTLWE